MFYFNKEEKTNMIFSSVIVSFLVANSKRAHPPGHFSGICHLVGPGGGELVQKAWSIDDRKGRGKN